MHARLVDHEPRPGLQGSDLVPQDLDAVLIRPVMEHCTEEVDIRAVDRLFVEEVVRHEADPALEVRRHVRWAFRDHIGKVLDDEVEVGEALRESDTYGAVAASDVDDRSAMEGCPVEALG